MISIVGFIHPAADEEVLRFQRPKPAVIIARYTDVNTLPRPELHDRRVIWLDIQLKELNSHGLDNIVSNYVLGGEPQWASFMPGHGATANMGNRAVMVMTDLHHL